MLMGEVIHGDYSRWVNGETLHSVTNYALHKALYSGHNDHNYFEIAHTVKYLQNMGNLDLYNFVDNHDVERIYTKLSNKAHFTPVHILLYTLPGVRVFIMVPSSELRAARSVLLMTVSALPFHLMIMKLLWKAIHVLPLLQLSDRSDSTHLH